MATMDTIAVEESKSYPWYIPALTHPLTSPPEPTAASKVFSTTELLESILLTLPPQDLLLSQTVCHQFRSVVQGSITIKKRLFLSPGSASDTSTFNEWHIIPYDRHGKPKSNTHNSTTLFQHHEIAINPLILQDLDSDQLPSLSELAAAAPTTRGKKKMIILFLRPELLLAKDEASCRDMFITQPPREVEVLDVEFGILWAWDGEPRPKRMRSFGKGRTVGELVDGVREVVEKGEGLRIVRGVRWVVGVEEVGGEGEEE